jgi:hypothetical protein
MFIHKSCYFGCEAPECAWKNVLRIWQYALTLQQNVQQSARLCVRAREPGDAE